MKNKFEALTTFQSWPKEWQRLCAEFWAASDMGEQVTVWTTSDKLEAAGQLMQPQRRRAARPDAVASIQAGRPVYRGDFGIAEREYLAKCHHETRTRRQAANMFLDRYPGRSVQAVEIKIRKMLDANGVVHVGY